MIARASVLIVLAGSLSLAGCRSPTSIDDEAACPVSRGHGNYGCARVVLVVEPPPQPWPEQYRWTATAMPAREGSGADLAVATQPGPGKVLITIMRRVPPAHGSGDTASVWVAAKMLEDPRPIQVGVPLPVFAADSALHVVRFAAAGQRPTVDTVTLTLKRD